MLSLLGGGMYLFVLASGVLLMFLCEYDFPLYVWKLSNLASATFAFHLAASTFAMSCIFNSFCM